VFGYFSGRDAWLPFGLSRARARARAKSGGGHARSEGGTRRGKRDSYFREIRCARDGNGNEPAGGLEASHTRQHFPVTFHDETRTVIPFHLELHSHDIIAKSRSHICRRVMQYPRSVVALCPELRSLFTPSGEATLSLSLFLSLSHTHLTREPRDSEREHMRSKVL